MVESFLKMWETMMSSYIEMCEIMLIMQFQAQGMTNFLPMQQSTQQLTMLPSGEIVDNTTGEVVGYGKAS